jgi:NAD(P)-dependent dehydrogenase (short-subunit alcohol dehydrogenase family)
MTQRVAVITGGLGVLGSALAQAARGRGWLTAVIDHAAAAPAPPESLVLAGVDLSDAEQATRAMAAVVERFGRLEALFNIAGAFRWITLADSDPGVWEMLFRINVQTAANASRAALPALKRSGAGRIVNVGAAAALKAEAGMGPYAAAKSGVCRLTEALAQELKDEGVTVNAVLPTIIDTPQNRADMPKADFSRWVAPAALAEVILFLGSEEAGAVTGALIPVAGRV